MPAGCCSFYNTVPSESISLFGLNSSTQFVPGWVFSSLMANAHLFSCVTVATPIFLSVLDVKEITRPLYLPSQKLGKDTSMLGNDTRALGNYTDALGNYTNALDKVPACWVLYQRTRQLYHQKNLSSEKRNTQKVFFFFEILIQKKLQVNCSINR